MHGGSILMILKFPKALNITSPGKFAQEISDNYVNMFHIEKMIRNKILKFENKYLHINHFFYIKRIICVIDGVQEQNSTGFHCQISHPLLQLKIPAG